MLIQDLLLAGMAIAFLIDAWYTRKWLRQGMETQKEMRECAERILAASQPGKGGPQ